jgi:hypothetical protein
MKAFPVITAFLLLSAFRLCGEGGDADINGLFDAPASDAVGVVSTASAIDRFLKEDGIRITGSFNVSGGYAYAWAERPHYQEAFTDLKDGKWDGFAKYMLMDASGSAYFTLTSHIDIEARPHPSLRFKASMGSEFPTWTPTVGEVFCDYTLADAVFFRIGRFGMTWGNARIYGIDNLPGRVPSGVHPPDSTLDSDGLSLKADVPFGSHSVSAVIMERNGYHKDPANPAPSELGYGLLGDFVWGRTQFSLGGFYQAYLQPRVLIAAKTSFLGVDLSGECVLAYAENTGLAPSWNAGVYWEQADWNLSIYCEYLYNTDSEIAIVTGPASICPPGHSVALILGLKEVFGSKLKAGLQWQHAFADGSGFLAPGVSIEAVPHIVISFGIPKYYGPIDGFLTAVNPDPQKRRTAIAVMVAVSEEF